MSTILSRPSLSRRFWPAWLSSLLVSRPFLNGVTPTLSRDALAAATDSAHGFGIRIEGVEQDFGSYPALRDVSLDIAPGELVALLGPSGSGKTTLLRVIAGLNTPDRGAVYFGDEHATNLSVRERRVGFVFQNYALFKHMTVADNIAFGLKARPSYV